MTQDSYYSDNYAAGQASLKATGLGEISTLVFIPIAKWILGPSSVNAGSSILVAIPSVSTDLSLPRPLFISFPSPDKKI